MHQLGYTLGSLCAQNVYYVGVAIPYGKLHIPGLQKLGVKPRNLSHALWPYYEQVQDPITVESDVLAAAVLVLEALHADEPCRSTWKELISQP